VVQKTAQSLWHHNFATVHHRVMRFLAKNVLKEILYMTKVSGPPRIRSQRDRVELRKLNVSFQRTCNDSGTASVWSLCSRE